LGWNSSIASHPGCAAVGEKARVETDDDIGAAIAGLIQRIPGYQPQMGKGKGV